MYTRPEFTMPRVGWAGWGGGGGVKYYPTSSAPSPRRDNEAQTGRGMMFTFRTAAVRKERGALWEAGGGGRVGAGSGRGGVSEFTPQRQITRSTLRRSSLELTLGRESGRHARRHAGGWRAEEGAEPSNAPRLRGHRSWRS